MPWNLDDSSPDVPLARPLGVDPFAFETPPPDDDPMLCRDLPRRGAWFDAFALLLLLFTFEIGFGALHAILYGVEAEPVNGFEDGDATAEPKLPFLFLSLRAVVSFVVVALFLRSRRQSAASVGLSARQLVINIVLGILATPVAYGLVWLITLTVWLLWPGFMDQMDENIERLGALIPSMHVMSYAGLALVIGVYEELIFRGFLLTRVRRGMGGWFSAVIFTSLLFTALHAFEQTVAALIMVTVLSLVFSVLTIWRRSIVPAIVTHILWNFTQFIYLDDYFQQLSAPP